MSEEMLRDFSFTILSCNAMFASMSTFLLVTRCGTFNMVLEGVSAADRHEARSKPSVFLNFMEFIMDGFPEGIPTWANGPQIALELLALADLLSALDRCCEGGDLGPFLPLLVGALVESFVGFLAIVTVVVLALTIAGTATTLLTGTTVDTMEPPVALTALEVRGSRLLALRDKGNAGVVSVFIGVGEITLGRKLTLLLTCAARATAIGSINSHCTAISVVTAFGS
eukprot:GDKK01035706.1.p1 GENE.GDKK01035706.1~~GDKK01035706.1.p1  ORF type:complete len:253 (-),score=-7.89 GDKK01035706.1:30-707(-)